MDEPTIPLISPVVAGPLGVMHLPRLWLKMLLFSYGRLQEAYRHGHGGLDEKLIVALGIDVDAMIAFVESEKPDYQAFEAWVRANAMKLTPESIAALNAAILAERVPEHIAVKRREQFNIADPTFAGAIPLINLDDWAGIHAQLAAQQPVRTP